MQRNNLSSNPRTRRWWTSSGRLCGRRCIPCSPTSVGSSPAYHRSVLAFAALSCQLLPCSEPTTAISTANGSRILPFTALSCQLPPCPVPTAALFCATYRRINCHLRRAICRPILPTAALSCAKCRPILCPLPPYPVPTTAIATAERSLILPAAAISCANCRTILPTGASRIDRLLSGAHRHLAGNDLGSGFSFFLFRGWGFGCGV